MLRKYPSASAVSSEWACIAANARLAKRVCAPMRTGAGAGSDATQTQLGRQLRRTSSVNGTFGGAA
jgi:hypothetical protein